MSKTRVISRIDIKNENVIKGIQFDGLRKLGDPNHFARKYYEQGADEIIFMDAVASLYDRNSLHEIIDKASQEVFIPITVGGGIRCLNDIYKSLEAGADKVAINTRAIHNPEFITEGAKVFGSQCIVGSIEAKHQNGWWEAYYDNGREKTNKNVIEWANILQELGAGEIFITSVDKDGTQTGFDCKLVDALSTVLSVPIIYSGGCGTLQHVEDVCKNNSLDALAFGSVLHYDKQQIHDIKGVMRQCGLRVRQ